jgi:hypothetical protein
MFGLPQGNLYINSIDIENSVMITDITTYEDFIYEIGVVLKIRGNMDNIDCFIYNDKFRYFAITLKDYLEIKGV